MKIMSTITLQLSSELEQQLTSAATEQGIEPDIYILNTLQERFQANKPVATTESELIQQINIGLSPAEWVQYHDLIAKRQAETLTQHEHQQLIATSDRLEQLNVHRIQALIELAKLRHKTLPELMNSLGIDSSPEILDYA
jgi:predicted RNA-binding protein with PIN domain